MCARGATEEAAVGQASLVAAVSANLLPISFPAPSCITTGEVATDPASGVLSDFAEIIVEDISTRLHTHAAGHIPLGHFVSSIQPKTNYKILHQVGECSLVPGADYANYIIHGDVRPDECEFNSYCVNCFGKAVRPSLPTPAGFESSSELASGTDDSE